MVGLKLECTASIGSVYWQSFQETPKVSQKEQPAISGNWGIFSSAAGISSNYLSKCNPIVFCLFFSFQLIIHSPGYFRHFVCFPRYGFTPFSRWIPIDVFLQLTAIPWLLQLWRRKAGPQRARKANLIMTAIFPFFLIWWEAWQLAGKPRDNIRWKWLYYRSPKILQPHLLMKTPTPTRKKCFSDINKVTYKEHRRRQQEKKITTRNHYVISVAAKPFCRKPIKIQKITEGCESGCKHSSAK